MRALTTLCCTLALSTVISIWKSPTGQLFTCQQIKTKHGTTVMCAPPPKSRTST
jgi:hypothetical protein